MVDPQDLLNWQSPMLVPEGRYVLWGGECQGRCMLGERQAVGRHVPEMRCVLERGARWGKVQGGMFWGR